MLRLRPTHFKVFKALTCRQTAPISRILSTTATDDDYKLRNDVKMLGTILGNSIKDYDPKVFEAVEKLRLLGREWRSVDGDKSAFDSIVAEVDTFDANMLLGVSRSFSHFLALSNSAEIYHRIRRLRGNLISSGTEYGLWSKHDSSAGAIRNLLYKQNIPPKDIIEALKSQKVEIVLTAHPTEVNRRTMLQKHHRITEILEQFDRPDLTTYERKLLENELKGEIASIWESDDLRRSKPSPVDEAKAGIAIVENVLWNAVPKFIRKLDDIVKNELHESLPLDITPLKIASWMGGDRDGNPNVTPAITLEVSMLSRWMAATLFKADILKLRAKLSLRTCSEELKVLSKNAREPYREVLKQIEGRLQATIEWTQNHTSSGYSNSMTMLSTVLQGENAPKPYKNSKELMNTLLIIYNSLISTGKEEVANGELVDTIRRLAIFGLSLMSLDIRQESTRHTEALDAITRYLGVGSYQQWDENTRRNWIQTELSSKRPLLPRHQDLSSFGFSATVVDTLKTFELASSLDEDSLGAYVISQCQQASDILAVKLLQQDAGIQPALRVVPLFETLDDLDRSAEVIDALFSINAYRGSIGNKQEIMVGYSDSAKDAGRLAASWAQYNAQVAMIDIANKYGVEVTFFHGKGGTVGRGGNPALYEAILAHPPHTINGRFRVTEQGEMITRNLGQEAVAERTLDLFTAGVLSERFVYRPEVKTEWLAMMERLSEISCAEYRQVVRGEERFVPYFRSATPELELSGLNVGSRPAKRNPKGGVESLRAIPWVFAWTQTRLNLPTWLGVGTALSKEMESHPVLLRQMYKEWPWFKTLIDLFEMILVKSEPKIAENYDHQLVTDEASLALGKELRDKLEKTSQAVLAVSGNPHLQANNPQLLKSLLVRNPYVDALNIMQAELLRRLRSNETYTDEERTVMQDALLITINGVVNGMRNSG
eukprot:gene5192-10384_t